MPISGTPTTPGDDTVGVTPTGNYAVDGGTGTDTLVINYSNLSTNIEYWYDGAYNYGDGFFSSVRFWNFETYRLTGGSGDDRLVGGANADYLAGGWGNDWITSGLGADVINGGPGVDLWEADYGSLNTQISVTLSAIGSVIVVGTGAEVSNIERVNLNLGANSDHVDTSAFVGNDTVNGNGGNDWIALGRGVDVTNGGVDTDTLVMDWSGISNPTQGIWFWYDGWNHYSSLSGDSLSFTNFEIYNLTGGAGSDDLRGGNDADILIGNGGNDTLRGYQGTDTIFGGAGVDLWEVNTANLNGTLNIDLNSQSSDGGHTLSGIERFHYTGGDAEDNVTALDGVFDDVINTNNGNDRVETFRGVDWVNGGANEDTLVMDWTGITNVTHGITYWYDGWHHFQSNSGDALGFVNFEHYNLFGGAGGDDLRGGNDVDDLRGGDGNDRLSGYRGDDLIDGGAGTDIWIGDTSDQPFSFNFSAMSSQTTAQGSAIGLRVRNIEQIDLSTGAANDYIVTTGFDLNDTLNTNGGSDKVNLGGGHDVYNGGTGTDYLIVDYRAATQSVHRTYDGWYHYTDDSGLRSIAFTNVERFMILGGSGNDSLVGGGLNDILLGYAGDDTLDVGAGLDKAKGGTGNDTVVKDDSAVLGSETISISANGNGVIAETGTVFLSIENFHLNTGTGDDTIYLGAGGNDIINSNGGNDTVNVGQGHVDTANGGTGTDTLIADLSMYQGGVYNSYDGWYHFRTVAGDESLNYINFEALNITGTNFGDRLFTGAGNDILNGGGGNDRLNGGADNDMLRGGAGNDMFLFYNNASAQGIDTILDGTAGDFIRISGLTVLGMSAGNGSSVLAGEVALESAGGFTTLHVGLNGTAGADLEITLTGTYGVGDFNISGASSDIFFL